MVALFLAMGVASPLWMQAIDTYAAPTASPATTPTTAVLNSQGGAR
jgi:hypothetical protein